MNARHKREIPSSARNACYELFGFDIMLDQHLKPWLIEVNTGPSLSAPTNLDQHIKHKMVSNLFNLVGIAPYDKNKARQRRYARLTGVPTTATTRVSVSASSGLRPPSVSRLISVETQRGQKNPHKFSSRPNTPAPCQFQRRVTSALQLIGGARQGLAPSAAPPAPPSSLC